MLIGYALSFLTSLAIINYTEYTQRSNQRESFISPTASGKSLMIYALVAYYTQRDENILIVVPTTSLVEQMYKDFEDYGFDVGSFCHKIYGGKEIQTNKQVTIQLGNLFTRCPSLSLRSTML